MNADEIISVGAPLPTISGAKPLDGRKVEITWEGGGTKVVDLAPVLASRRVFIPLRSDDELFRTLKVGERGSHIEWANGADFSAVWLERLPSTGMTNAEFREAMDQAGLTLDGMAAALEISRRQIADYRREKRIPNHVAYATRYLVEHEKQ